MGVDQSDPEAGASELVNGTKKTVSDNAVQKRRRRSLVSIPTTFCRPIEAQRQNRTIQVPGQRFSV